MDRKRNVKHVWEFVAKHRDTDDERLEEFVVRVVSYDYARAFGQAAEFAVRKKGTIFSVEYVGCRLLSEEEKNDVHVLAKALES